VQVNLTSAIERSRGDAAINVAVIELHGGLGREDRARDADGVDVQRRGLVEVEEDLLENDARREHDVGVTEHHRRASDVDGRPRILMREKERVRELMSDVDQMNQATLGIDRRTRGTLMWIERALWKLVASTLKMLLPLLVPLSWRSVNDSTDGELAGVKPMLVESFLS